ncbi:2-polyprenyl-6-methoxyphenol hydroxylase-like FAD-dependent oxidoreductase [Saccharothrix carnea]|uniref:2-polyprenyl-6-methoxyphenol hydroxylase-like FAD-dependent oxidoreductase n=1 Tax=Saccharothrix carnea TaxID=1280637 RepID=A0A2P8HZ61_SACCR|nr:FAD-dependent monooxygenase [Saccharothrix carnea]PSL51485.1 2-polyprenyl-6-methoxyphenol hydroxylase-like FAD-dependent oxidoreductase [Saccharothrix carnea]
MADRHTTGGHVPVLIAGGGVTGLSAAVFLAWHGVPTMLVERREQPLADPRARALNPRTMELYRAVDLEEAIRQVRSPIADHGVVAHARTVAGPELTRLPDRLGTDTGALSPCDWAAIDQNQLEPLLRDRAASDGVDVRYNTEAVAVTNRPNGVEAFLRSHRTGHEQRVRADYLVAADGAHSPLRRMLDIGHDDTGTLARKVNVYFDADLREVLRGRKIVALTVRNPAVQGFLTSVDGVKRWRFAISLAPGEDGAITETRCVQLLRAAIGVDDLPLVIERVSETPWEIAGRVSHRMCTGRVFIAGDAAHTMPPVGTFGVATGVQDAFNLAWKIALHHRDLAGPGLLTSYETERLPVARHTTRLTVDRYGLVNGRSGDARESARGQRMTMFGYTYPAGAISPNGATPDLVEDPDHPSGAPGTRAPHVLLEHRGKPLSPVDLMGRDFTLLTDTTDTDWAGIAAEAAARTGINIGHCRIGHPSHNRTDPAARHYRLDGGAILIRPDGFIAWRAPTSTDRETFIAALDRILFR